MSNLILNFACVKDFIRRSLGENHAKVPDQPSRFGKEVRNSETNDQRLAK